MTEPPDYASLARQYLDLWEEQLTAIASDPALAAQMSAMFGLVGQMMPLSMPGASSGADGSSDPMAAMQKTMVEMMAAAGMPPPGEKAGDTDDKARPASRPTTGAASPAATSGDGDQRLDELARRLAAVEEQLAAVAAGSGESRRKPAGKPRRHKSAKPR